MFSSEKVINYKVLGLKSFSLYNLGFEKLWILYAAPIFSGMQIFNHPYKFTFRDGCIFQLPIKIYIFLGTAEKPSQL